MVFNYRIAVHGLSTLNTEGEGSDMQQAKIPLMLH